MLHLFDHQYLFLKCINQIPALELSLSVPLVLLLQAVFRRAGARGLIMTSCCCLVGIRLLMFSTMLRSNLDLSDSVLDILHGLGQGAGTGSQKR